MVIGNGLEKKSRLISNYGAFFCCAAFYFCVFEYFIELGAPL